MALQHAANKRVRNRAATARERSSMFFHSSVSKRVFDVRVLLQLNTSLGFAGSAVELNQSAMLTLQNQFERNFLTTSVDYVFNWARKSALWPLTFGLACCAIEMIASSTARFDIARFGAEVF